MDMHTLGSRIARGRSNRQLAQRELAFLCQTSRSRVCDWELDRRTPTQTEWARIVEHLGIPYSWLEKLRLDLTELETNVTTLFPQKRMGLYLQPRDRKTFIRLLAFRRSHKEEFDRIWAELKQSPYWPLIRRFLLYVPTDGQQEVETWMRLLIKLHKPIWVSMLKLGYRRLPVVDPIDRRNVCDGRMPALLREHPDRPGVIVPQVPLLCENEVLRPDGLITVHAHGKTRHCGMEIDRVPVYSDEARARADKMRMPILRYSHTDIRHPDFDVRLWDDVYTTLWPADALAA